MSALLDIARKVAAEARSLGAQEVSVSVARSSESSIVRRAGKIEQATSATSLGVSLSVLVDDRYSVHASSDIRPDALTAFLVRAIEATRVLEPEVERRQPPVELCGRGASEEALDAWDASAERLGAEARRTAAEALEAAVDALPERSRVLSAAVFVGDSVNESARVMSNGFEGTHRSTGFGHGAEMTLADADGRRPEGYAYYSALYQEDLPDFEAVARECWRRSAQRLGSGPMASGRYPMLLDAPAVGRILGVLGAPLSGGELHQKRSFLIGKLGERIGNARFTLLDDPHIRRGLGSRAWDGDALIARPMPIVEAGVLSNYYINTYYGRKLGMAPTTGGRSNWVVPPGARGVAAIAEGLERAILVTGFLGGNSNAQTGDFSFGVSGVLLERGAPVKNLSEMNVSGNITDVLGNFVESADDVWTFGSCRSGTLLFDDVAFSGT